MVVHVPELESNEIIWLFIGSQVSRWCGTCGCDIELITISSVHYTAHFTRSGIFYHGAFPLVVLHDSCNAVHLLIPVKSRTMYTKLWLEVRQVSTERVGSEVNALDARLTQSP